MTYTCFNCGDTYISDYTEATGHDWDNDTVITNSTCESEGVLEYTCKNCGAEYIGDYEKIPEHNYEKVVTEPTRTSIIDYNPAAFFLHSRYILQNCSNFL